MDEICRPRFSAWSLGQNRCLENHSRGLLEGRLKKCSNGSIAGRTSSQPQLTSEPNRKAPRFPGAEEGLAG